MAARRRRRAGAHTQQEGGGVRPGALHGIRRLEVGGGAQVDRGQIQPSRGRRARRSRPRTASGGGAGLVAERGPALAFSS